MRRPRTKEVRWFRRRCVTPLWGAAIGVAALLIYWPGVIGLIPGLEGYSDLKPLRSLDLRIADFLHTRFAVKPPTDDIPRICVVGVMQRGLDKYGQMPWPRQKHAQLVRTLQKKGAKVIAFDIFFAEPGEDDDGFARACREAGNVILPLWGEFRSEQAPDSADAERRSAVLPFGVNRSASQPRRSSRGIFREPLRETVETIYGSAFDCGHINVFYDKDLVARRVPVAVGEPLEKAYYFPLGIVAAMNSRGIPASEAIVTHDSLFFGKTRIPLDQSGCILINYRPFEAWIDRRSLDLRAIESDVDWLKAAGSGAPIKFFSYLDVLEDRVPDGAFKDAVVFVGQCIRGSREDVHVTPEGSQFGVFLQAMLFYTAATRQFLVRLEGGWTALLVFGLSVLLGTFCFTLRFRGSTYVIAAGGLILIGFGVLATLIAVGLLRGQGIIVPSTPFVMVIVLNLLGGMAASTARVTKEAERRGREMELLLAASEKQAVGWPGGEASEPKVIPGAEQIEISTSLAKRSARIVIETFRQAISCEGCAVYPVDEGDCLEVEHAIFDGMAGEGSREYLEVVAERFANETRRIGQPLVRAAEDPDWPYVNLAPRLQTILGVPVVVRGRALAVILMFNKRATDGSPSRHFADEDLRLVGALCYQAAALLENSRRYRLEYAMFDGFARSLAKAVDLRDKYTQGHSERVAEFSAGIARELGLTDPEVEIVQRAATLHDVGKIGISDSLLNKAGVLTDEEFEVIRSHAVKGFEILKTAPSFEPLVPGIRHHHERYDGKGYPDGLAGNRIPLVARILAAADAYDAMTSNRIYRQALPKEEARRELVRGAGTQFDPVVVKAFLRYIHKQSDRQARIAADSRAAHSTVTA